jgi:hypothetical protein
MSSHDAQKIRDLVYTVIQGLHTPRFVYDDYFDIVATNSGSLPLHGFPTTSPDMVPLRAVEKA